MSDLISGLTIQLQLPGTTIDGLKKNNVGDLRIIGVSRVDEYHENFIGTMAQNFFCYLALKMLGPELHFIYGV